MITSKKIRPLTVGLLTAVASAGALVIASPANAAVDGTLSFAPKLGANTTAITATSSGACTNPSATNIQVKVTGTGFPAAGQIVVGNSSITAYGVAPSGGLIVPLAQTMQDYANLQSPVVPLNGKYDFTLTCKLSTGSTSLGDYTGSLWFTSATAYQDIDPAGSAASSVTLSATPASPQVEGTSVALTATVDAASRAYGGTVTFKDGATTIGSPATVNTTTGVATLSTGSLSVGTHSLTAVYNAGVSGIASSTSTPATSYTITDAPACDTLTSLSIAPSSNAGPPGTPDPYTLVTLTATTAKDPADTRPVCAARTLAGTVQFKDGSTNIGSPVAISAGNAAIQQQYPLGVHSFSAEFTPTNANLFDPSSSNSQSYEVYAAGCVVGDPCSATEQISTTVAAGSLVISVAGPTVTLPTPVLDTNGTLFTTSGDIKDVTVTDTRAGNPGWTLNGILTDYQGPGANKINGSNTGWTPLLRSKAAAQTVNLGGVVAPGEGLAVGAIAGSGIGLKTGRVLASAPVGFGNGSAVVGATLALNVPTSTLAGTYTAILTLTAV